MSNFSVGLLKGLGQGLAQQREYQTLQQQQQTNEEIRKAQVKLYEAQLKQAEYNQRKQEEKQEALRSMMQAQGNPQLLEQVKQLYPEMYYDMDAKIKEAEQRDVISQMIRAQLGGGAPGGGKGAGGAIPGGGGMGVSGITLSGKGNATLNYGYPGPPSFSPPAQLPGGGVGRYQYDPRSGAPVGVLPEPPAWTNITETTPEGEQTVAVDPNMPGNRRVLGTRERELPGETAGRAAGAVIGLDTMAKLQQGLKKPDGSYDKFKVAQLALGAPNSGMPAFKDAIDNVLRVRSGAAAGPSELETLYAQFLPQPWDNSQTMDDKFDRFRRFSEGYLEGIRVPDKIRQTWKGPQQAQPQHPVLIGDPYQNMSDEEINARIDELERKLQRMRGK